MAVVAVGCVSLGATAAELGGYLGVEQRGFFERGVQSPRRGVSSLIAQPELVLRSESDKERLIIQPFYRWDSEDENRTHFDLRELAIEIQRDAVDVRAGVRKVFWGVAESQHVVDVVNQTDLVESLDLEEKLGQPMLSLSWRPSFASFEVHLLPYFRERQFKRAGTRLGPAAPVLEEARYESAERRRHVDAAARVQFAPLEALELALSYFRGTNREPQLLAVEQGLVPYYSIIGQSGLELQWVHGSLAVKSELFYRAEQGEDTLRAVYGFEYTLYQFAQSRRDLGLILEHNYDSRKSQALTVLQNDLFIGARLNFNNEASSELIAGVFFDADYESLIGKLEWKHRLGDALTAALNVFSFHEAKQPEALYASRKDGLIELTMQYHL